MHVNGVPNQDMFLCNMSGTLRFCPSLNRPTPLPHSPDFLVPHQILSVSTSKNLSLPANFASFSGKIGCVIKDEKFIGVSREGSVQELEDDDAPVSIELSPITSESQFDRVIAEAQQLEESVIIIWVATWCRKCIYLKPKLEKLAADYHPRLRFYYIDVNTVPHKLVNRAGVTKMPTIQLWKDGKKQGEVVGGHKAYLVINEVRQMIEN